MYDVAQMFVSKLDTNTTKMLGTQMSDVDRRADLI